MILIRQTKGKITEHHCKVDVDVERCVTEGSWKNGGIRMNGVAATGNDKQQQQRKCEEKERESE